MAKRSDLQEWILEALIALGGKALISDVAEVIWNKHKSELERSGKLFFTWQYDMRWAAMKLRKSGKLAASNKTPRGTWAFK